MYGHNELFLLNADTRQQYVNPVFESNKIERSQKNKCNNIEALKYYVSWAVVLNTKLSIVKYAFCVIRLGCNFGGGL